MPRVKPVHTGLKLLPVDCDTPVQPGSCEHALGALGDHELDRTELRGGSRHAGEGASADAPAVRLKIVLLADSRGMVGRRQSAVAGRENGRCMAVAGEAPPHVTTRADFISRLGDAVAHRAPRGARWAIGRD